MSIRPDLSPMLAHGLCSAAEWPLLLEALDAEFVAARGRSGSLAARYPDSLRSDLLSNVVVGRLGGQLVSCCVVREFDWCSPRERWQAAMIGMVYTDPAFRGKGYAAQVLDAAVNLLKARKVDVAVLWSGLPHFYERLGWERHDRGVLGTFELAPVPVTTAAGVEGITLEDFRHEHQRWCMPRTPAGWQATPLPAYQTVIHGASGPGRAYALAGVLEGTRYVYEVVGAEDDFADLWQALCAGASRVCINECIGSPFHRWLARHTAVKFTGQSLTHWRVLSPRGQRAPWRGWYIPWFDRI